jgi:hypothetical protein
VLVSGHQKPLATRPADYVEVGFLAVGQAADGLPLMGGGDPPEQALLLTADNLVCTEDESSGRAACEFFVEQLTEAEGVAKGFEELRQVRCYCTRLATSSELMEVGEVAVFACSARRPQDLTSKNLLKKFRARQRDMAAEHAQVTGETDL